MKMTPEQLEWLFSKGREFVNDDEVPEGIRSPEGCITMGYFVAWINDKYGKRQTELES